MKSLSLPCSEPVSTEQHSLFAGSVYTGKLPWQTADIFGEHPEFLANMEKTTPESTAVE
jgi:hypothetical protein